MSMNVPEDEGRPNSPDDVSRFSEGDDDELVFADDKDLQLPECQMEPWKVLIVDDDDEVHDVTKLALGEFLFQSKPLLFISAYSADEAMELIKHHPDAAVVLLDVVMEEEDSGLKFVKFLRNDLENPLIRIILRTGQPGQAPEDKVILDYDINDYKTKTELTAQKLFNSMIVALRSYHDLLTIESQKEQLESLVGAFERFVPHEFLSFLEKESIADVRLGDQVQKEMTVLFSDVRDFTALSEKMTPEENFKFTNSYLSRMEPHIRKYRGFVDKFIGDAIMALFPTGAEDAVRAGIEMLNALVEYNTHRGKVGYPPVRIGIGLNSGDLMLGTVGGESRMDGTVISDAVNLASRMENLTKMYGTSLLISERTFDRLPDPSPFDSRMIGQVKVKGKSEAVRVYEVFDGDQPEIVELKIQTLPDFDRALALYRNREFVEAQRLFENVLKVNGNDPVAKLYSARCGEFQKAGLPDGWEGTEMLG